MDRGAPRIRIMLAASVDGYVATPDGAVAWLEAWDPRTLGIDDFLTGIGALIFGRRTFDQALTFGRWPYGDRPVFVITGRPIDDGPPSLKAASGDVRAIAEQARAAAAPLDVWHVGGPQSIAPFLDQGLADELEIFYLPILLGHGIPLFPQRGDRALPLTLLTHRRFDSGVVMLRYAIG